MAVLALLAAGCESDSPAEPGTLRFGQIGEARLTLRVPLHLGQGELVERLTWNSSGPWRLVETLSYRGTVGEEDVVNSSQNPEVLAGSYAQWITQINDVQALSLFIDDLDPSLAPDCGRGRTRVSLGLRDDSRGEEREWVRCVAGTLATLTTADAGPDPAASRVAAATILARDFTLGEGFRSTYRASLPFATVERASDSGLDLDRPRVVTNAEDWETFWAGHAGPEEPVPEVNFEEDVVLVAAVGVRQEAGDSVEVRRVLSVDDGTVVELAERVPGDFCSPAELTHTPTHIVVTPRIPLPVRFVELPVERVPCG